MVFSGSPEFLFSSQHDRETLPGKKAGGRKNFSLFSHTQFSTQSCVISANSARRNERGRGAGEGLRRLMQACYKTVTSSIRSISKEKCEGAIIMMEPDPEGERKRDMSLPTERLKAREEGNNCTSIVSRRCRGYLSLTFMAVFG